MKTSGLPVSICKASPLRRSRSSIASLMIPVYVFTPDPAGTFGPGAFIEFYGEALDTLYTDTNIYTLQVSSGPVPHIPELEAQPNSNLVPAESYTYAMTFNRQLNYNSTSPGSEPWGDTSMLVYTTSKSWDFTFQADDLADPSAPANLQLTVWGITDWPQSPDHHLVVSLNGITVADELFDGHIQKTLNLQLPGGTLNPGTNTLRLTLPGDRGVSNELITFDQFTLTYPRSFVLDNDQLSFTAAGDLFQVAEPA